MLLSQTRICQLSKEVASFQSKFAETPPTDIKNCEGNHASVASQ
jgi:hypothetical protein